MLLALVIFEVYLLLPPGIPWVTSPDLLPIRWRLANIAFGGLATYSLYAYGFSLIDSIGLGFARFTLMVYLIFDYFYDVPLMS